MAKTVIGRSLLNPTDHVPILIDQQYLQLLTARSHDTTLLVNAMALLARGKKLFGVKTLPTTAHVGGTGGGARRVRIGSS
jgi:hypothetical protein